MLEGSSERRLLVEFRATAKPPAVVISADETEALLSLRQALLGLATAEVEATVAVAELESVALKDLDEFLLVRAIDSERLWPVIEADRRHDATVVTWRGRHDDWITRAALIDGLIESEQPGHQFLTGYESFDPIEIVVSFRSGGRY